jgi:DNA-binding response OmpR family regulator
VCRALGAGRDRLPVILLTAKNRQEDKVRGLELGADDYVTKPFALDELLARIHAVLRRSQRSPQRLTLGGVVIDFGRMRATREGVPLLLTPREVALLQYLSEREGKVVTRDELLRVVWGYAEVPMTRTVDNFVARLRRKIEPDPHAPRFIRTMHGDGYSLTISADA